MFSLIYTWFKRQKTITKIFIGLSVITLTYATIQTARLSYSEYKRLKYVEKQYKKAVEEIQLREENELKLIEKSKLRTQRSKLSNIDIDKKLKQDEKTIDSSDIDNSDVLRFVSKHQKR